VSETRLIKLNLVDVFNEVITYLADKVAEGEELPRNLQVLDMKFEMIRNHLTHVAQRALDLDDPVLKARLVALGMLTVDTSSEDPDGSTKGNA
jgi:hypothetical protein